MHVIANNAVISYPNKDMSEPHNEAPRFNERYPASEEAQEQNAWREILGSNVEVPPVPSFVTPEVRKNLELLGLELRYIPKLDLGTFGELKQVGPDDFAYRIQDRYPNWHAYEKLSEAQKKDPNVPRNLNSTFWELAYREEIEFPHLPGAWIAVETLDKPSYKDFYKRTHLAERILGIRDRFLARGEEVFEDIQYHREQLLAEAGLPDHLQVRMLEAIEWNLLGNREGWGATDSVEWTNTIERRRDSKPPIQFSAIAIGNSNWGGAGSASLTHNAEKEEDRDLDTGFRVAVILGT